MENRQPHLSLSDALKLLAVILWLLSLSLPGFLTPRADSWGNWTGWMLLAMMPFAFLQPTSCWALYSNIFFWVALLRKDGIISLGIMWLMTATIIFHTEIMIGEMPSYDSVLSWGWGAVLWLLSYIALTLARAVRHHSDPALFLCIAGFFCSLAITLLIGLNIYQYRSMNDEEREHLLPPSMAFTTQTISGIQIQPVPENFRLPADANIIVENAIPDLETLDATSLEDTDKPFPGAKPGYYYGILNPYDYPVIIARPGNVADYRYQIVPDTPQRFHITLRRGNGDPVWQQEFRTDSSRGIYPPLPEKIWRRDFPFYKEETYKEESDITLRACPLPQGGKHIRLHDMELILEKGEFLSQAFCNEKYTLILFMAEAKSRSGSLYIAAYLLNQRGDIIQGYDSITDWPNDVLLESATLSGNGRDLYLKAEKEETLLLDASSSLRTYRETANTHMLQQQP